VQFDTTVLEDRANFDRERLTALIALVKTFAGCLAFQLTRTANNATMRANTTISPQSALNKLVGGGFVVEVFSELYALGLYR